VTRRPWPALVALVLLLVLTALVWWRVFNRSSSASEAGPKPCPTPTAKVTYPAQDALSLTVLNATTKTGIAGRARSTLIADGFNVPALAANAPKERTNKITTVAEIAYGPASAQGAKLVQYYFPGATMAPSTTTSKTIVVSLGTTYKGVASQASVDAALRRDKARAGTPTPSPSPSPTC
jgi:hypothetical protein